MWRTPIRCPRVALLTLVVGITMLQCSTDPPVVRAALHVDGGASVFLPFVARLTRMGRAGEVLRLSFGEEPGATRFHDTGARGNDARCGGAECPAAGAVTKAGVSIQFRGPRNALWVPDAPALRPAFDRDLAFELWLLPTSTSCGRCTLVDKRDDGAGFALSIGDGSGGFPVEFALNDGTRSAITRSSEQVTLNRWHHLVATTDRAAGVARLYLDGAEVTYARQDGIAALGALANSADMAIGNSGHGDAGFLGMIDDLAMFYRMPGSAEIADAWRDRGLRADPWFPRWNSGQVRTVLEGSGIAVHELGPLTFGEWRQLTPLAAEATECEVGNGSRVFLMAFANPEDLTASLAEIQAVLPESERSKRVYVQDNLVVWITTGAAAGIHDEIARALAERMPATVMDAPHNTTPADFTDWGRFYPTDRGQRRDLATGRSQRTFDRWETPSNRWLFGQATWLYQDPFGTDAPPPAMPATYRDAPLLYYYHYHCEKESDPDRRKDCLNWRIYIEMLTEGEGGLSLDNWARGGWQGLQERAPRWEVFYRPETFSRCDLESVRAESGDADLYDPAAKAPLSFRLPATIGAYWASPEVCTVVFDSYRYRAEDVSAAEPWRTFTTLLGSATDPAVGRTVVKAQNRTYRYDSNINGDRLYRLRASETYWMRELVSEDPRSGGMQGYWFGTWRTPPEEHRDTNGEDRWSELQWCRIDADQGPPGLGALVCEP